MESDQDDYSDQDEDEDYNQFHIVKNSAGSSGINKDSAEFGKPQKNNQPRATFGLVDVRYTFFLT